jgi:hypothetical protein
LRPCPRPAPPRPVGLPGASLFASLFMPALYMCGLIFILQTHSRTVDYCFTLINMQWKQCIECLPPLCGSAGTDNPAKLDKRCAPLAIRPGGIYNHRSRKWTQNFQQ